LYAIHAFAAFLWVAINFHSARDPFFFFLSHDRDKLFNEKSWREKVATFPNARILVPIYRSLVQRARAMLSFFLPPCEPSEETRVSCSTPTDSIYDTKCSPPRTSPSLLQFYGSRLAGNAFSGRNYACRRFCF